MNGIYWGNQFHGGSKLIIKIFLFYSRAIFDKYNETTKVVKLFGQQEFDLPQSVIDITYSQTLCW